jgi:hypothetical protein
MFVRFRARRRATAAEETEEIERDRVAFEGTHVPTLAFRVGNVARTVIARAVPRLVRRPRIDLNRARLPRVGSGKARPRFWPRT